MSIEGVIFGIEIEPDRFSIGQILAEHKKGLMALSVALSRQVAVKKSSIEVLDFCAKDCVALVISTTDLFENSHINKGPKRKIAISRKQYPYHKEMKGDGIGVKMYQPGILVDFLRAYHGIIPWNSYHDPKYFDRLLVSPEAKPNNLVFK